MNLSAFHLACFSSATAAQHLPHTIACGTAHPAPMCLQELLSERARLQSEVEALRAAAAAEASSSKQELATQRAALEQQQASLLARMEAVTEGGWQAVAVKHRLVANCSLLLAYCCGCC
jgi:glucosamine 6-phosphate synthetase-like amidotransferase/phosphosugar isomerase protein